MSRCSMPARRTPTTYAILGLLNVRDWTTYELAKQVQRSLNWFWPRAERKLYDEPKRLVADGLATATSESTGKRPRTVYGITDAGREALRDWLDAPSAPRTSEFEGMVKVFFAEAGSLDQLHGTLDAIETETRGRLLELAELVDSGIEARRFPERMHLGALCMRLQLEQEVAVLRWVAWARDQVATWSATDDPGDWDPLRQYAAIAPTRTPPLAEGRGLIGRRAPRRRPVNEERGPPSVARGAASVVGQLGAKIARYRQVPSELTTDAPPVIRPLENGADRSEPSLEPYSTGWPPASVMPATALMLLVLASPVNCCAPTMSLSGVK